MPIGVKGWLMCMFFAFILWCVREAVVQYRFERKMQRMEAMMRQNGWPYGWKWIRGVRPLFHEQGEDDV